LSLCLQKYLLVDIITWFANFEYLGYFCAECPKILEGEMKGQIIFWIGYEGIKGQVHEGGGECTGIFLPENDIIITSTKAGHLEVFRGDGFVFEVQGEVEVPFDLAQKAKILLESEEELGTSYGLYMSVLMSLSLPPE